MAKSNLVKIEAINVGVHKNIAASVLNMARLMMVFLGTCLLWSVVRAFRLDTSKVIYPSIPQERVPVGIQNNKPCL